MAGPVRERPPEVARAGRMDPRLARAMGLSLGVHVAVVLGILLYSFFAPEPARLELPPGAGAIDVFTPRGDSAVFKVGPLARPGGQKPTVAERSSPPAPKPDTAKEPAPPAKASPPAPDPAPPPKPAPPPEPAPPKPPEPKPVVKDALPDPRIAEEKKLAEQKKLAEEKKLVEEKKLAEQKKQAEEKKLAEQKKQAEEKKLADEKKKAEEKKLAEEKKKAEEKRLADEKKKAEEKRLADEKKAEEKRLADEKKRVEEEQLAEARRRAEEKKRAADLAAKTTPGDEGGTTSRPGPAASGGGTATEPGSSGDPDGGGGGPGNRSPEFYAYIGYLYRTVKAQWVWVGEDSSLVAAVQFSILPDGNIADARITKRSRIPLYDESALKAVRASAPLTPPPASVARDFADVELVFEAGELMQR